jgi:ubiquinone/menaquinone biosynthesis C-methylase UbiE
MCGCDLAKMLGERESLMLRDYDSALDLASFDPRHTLLDVATGSGRMLQRIVLRGYSVISGDIDQAALDRARDRLGDMADKATLTLLDAHEMPFESDKFHGMTLANAVHEMDDVVGALDEMRRVLAPSGKLLVVEFNSHGFELMALHHEVEGKGEHRTGEMSTEQISDYMRSSFENVLMAESAIAYAWVGSNKKQVAER